MGKLRLRAEEWPLYAIGLLLAGAVVATAVILQITFVVHEIRPDFFVMPAMVIVVLGLLLGRLAVMRQRLRQKTAQFRAIVDIAHEFTYLRRVDGQYDYVSPSCLALTGYTQDEFYQIPNLMDLLIHPDDRHRWHNHVHHINDGGAAESFDMRLRTKDGREVWITHICMPVFDAKGRQTGVRSTNLDITQRKQDQSRIEHMALYDPLTELPNRRRLEQVVQELLAVRQPFAVLFLDLNRFKNINDSLGHAFGDQLLRQIARRLHAACPPDSLLCRFGGDEFILLHPAADNRDRVTRDATALLTAIETPLLLDGTELHVSATIGIAFATDDGDNADMLIRNADAAMYRAKRDPHSRIYFYREEYSHEAAHLMLTESHLYKALQQREFIPYYQPKVDMASGRIIGLEALARWQHPERGLITPDHFIPVAEETGKIVALGELLLLQVLADLQRWRELGMALPVSINVSPRQFAERDFWERLVHVVRDSGCAPGQIELEITEQVFLGDIDATAARLRHLREAGFTIALDDFGTGYSSFNYLCRLPIDTLKVDRSLVEQLEREQTSRAVLRSLIGMCRELGLDVVAEGVSTPAQQQTLQELGCRKAQGFLFHRPLARTQLEPLLAPQPAA